jgi:hypothetical protein
MSYALFHPAKAGAYQFSKAREAKCNEPSLVSVRDAGKQGVKLPYF